MENYQNKGIKNSKNFREAFVFRKSEIPKAEPISNRFLVFVFFLFGSTMLLFIVVCLIVLTININHQNNGVRGSFNHSCFTNDCEPAFICFKGICSCNDNLSWNGSKCIENSVTCDQNIDCLGDMICLGGTCSCTNILTHYFDSTARLCTLKTLDNTVCSSNLTCRTDLGLICVAGKCQCESSLRYWNGSTCVQYKLFNETCLTQSECWIHQETICNTSRCLCNSTSHFFDSSTDKCVSKLNDNVVCSQNIQCLSDLVCFNGKCSCFNTTTHYFSQTTFSCTPKTLNNTVCLTNSTCRTDLGLTCVSGRCQCDTTNMTWDDSNCVLRILCPSSWTSNSGFCYYLSSSSDTRSYISAKSYCSSQGGSLIMFKSSTEYTFFRSIIPADEFHIGLEKVNNIWLWVDGSPFDNSLWVSGKPGSDLCGRYSAHGIEDKSCGDVKRFICEK